jgi:hypothetical protein
MEYIEFEELPHIQFKEKENYEDFVINRKYIQVYRNNDTITICIVIYRETYENKLTYIDFDIYNKIKHSIIKHSKINLTKLNCFYEIVTKKNEIQNAMELRAFKKIMENILGHLY